MFPYLSHQDSKQNRVKDSKGLVIGSSGVIEGSFELSDQPVLEEDHAIMSFTIDQVTANQRPALE